jgi:hypothetical protein
VAVGLETNERVLVVKVTDDERRVRDGLVEFGTVEERSLPNVLLLRLDDSWEDVRLARDEILARVDGIEWAEFLLVDDSSSPVVPTGELSVRFHEPLSDDELVGFAEEHGLELRRRNEFVPEQAVFAPRRPRGEPLTERAEKLSHERDVREAWPNTASQYHRA